MIFSELQTFEKIYIVTSAVTAVGSAVLGFFVFSKNPRNPVNSSYLFMSLSVSLWSAALFVCHTSPLLVDALFWNRLLHLGSVMIPVTFFHFILNLLGVIRERRWVLRFGYFLAFVFASIAFSPLLVAGLAPKFDFRIWPVPGPAYPLFLVYFSFYAYYPLWLVLKKCLQSKGNRREQLKFIFIGVSIAFLGGSTNYAYVYDVAIPPVGNLFVIFYVIFLAYSIVRYRLMDIKVAFTKLGIFLSVYTLVLGVPFFLGFKDPQNWLLPVISMALLATLGPFVYLFLQKKAEERLLWEQRRYQKTLRQASAGMGRIRELGKLLNLIVFILARTVKISHVAVYIRQRESTVFSLGAIRRTQKAGPLMPDAIQAGSVLADFLSRNSSTLIYDELSHQPQPSMELIKELGSLQAALVFPIFIRSELSTIVVLGPKVGKRLYSEDDVAVFSILANQAALAIENALFYEDMTRTHEQLFKAEKMATIGIMADGLSHQINNRLHAMGFIAGDMMDTLNLKKDLFAGEELRALEEEFRKGFARLEDNVVHGRNIVQGLMKYTRKGEEGFVPCEVEAVLQSAWEMAQFKVKADRMKIAREAIVGSGVKVKANFTQLQEVFFNLIDNAYDAMMQRKDELSEEGYSPMLKVDVECLGDKVILVFQDNGMGVKDGDREKLFTPFFTTKATSSKGTGLGLYVIRKIVEENHGGRIEMISRYREGTTFRITLPAVI